MKQLVNDYGWLFLSQVYLYGKLVILSAITGLLYSLNQVNANRRGRTWLPWWLYSDRNWFDVKWVPQTVDGYHFSIWLAMFFAGLSFREMWQPWQAVIWWVVAGSVMSIFYHEAWMKPKYRDYWIRKFINKLKGGKDGKITIKSTLS